MQTLASLSRLLTFTVVLVVASTFMATAQFMGIESLYQNDAVSLPSQTTQKTSGLLIEETNPYGSYFGFPSTNTDLPKYGHRALYFNLPFEFSANGYNTGNDVDTNVQGIANVYDASGTLVISLPFSSITPRLFPGNSTHLGTTTPYTLSTIGYYDFELIVQSDSMGIPVNRDRDSVHIEYSDSVYALDFNEHSNTLGTPDFNAQALSVANYFVIDHHIGVAAIEIALANYTEPGAVLDVFIADTIGFSLSNGFRNNHTYFYSQHVVTATDTSKGYARINTIFNGIPIQISPDSSEGYYLVAVAYATTQHAIGFVNDSSVLQPGYASIFHLEDGNSRWYTGSTQGNVSNSFLNRLIITPPAVQSLDEYSSEDRIQIYPNPVQSEFQIHSDISLEGEIVRIFDLNGKLVLENKLNGAKPTLFVNHLENGMYTVRIQKDGEVLTSKFTVIK